MRIKHITVRVIPAEGHAEDKFTFRAPPGKQWNDLSREQIVEKVIEHLDKKYPFWNFRKVDVGPTQMNFVYDGLREGAVERQ
jgi:hypothetical protein